MSRSSLLALVTDAFGGFGGIAQYNRDLLTALASDYRIEVLPRHAPNQVGELAASPHQHKARQGRLAYAATAVTFSWHLRPDIVFCGHLFMAPLAALISRATGARLVVQFHGIEAWDAPRRLSRAAIERADLALCVSRYTRARVLSWSSLSPQRVVVLPNTVRDQFTPGNRTRARARFNLGEERVLLSVSRLDARERYKGQGSVIAALPNIVRANFNVTYLIAGEGDDRSRLECLAEEHGVRCRVRFLGKVATETLPDLYRAADLLVLPSTGEGFGIVFIESMACGTPALGLSKAGANDALCDGELGISVNGEDLADAICRALRHPSLAPAALAAEVQRRFGRQQFTERARALMNRFAQ